MDIYSAVDGTGPDDNSDYMKEFANSHCKRLYAEWHGRAKRWERGPSLTGSETQSLAVRQARFAKTQYDAHPGSRIFLAGYSRGGAAAEVACHILKRENVPVHCLLLFDAVDRSSVDTPGVPDNVDHCFHAMRDPRTASREIFGNCSTEKLGGRKMIKQKFYGTHGAIGGVPQTETGFLMDTVVELHLGGATAMSALGGLAGTYTAAQTRNTNVTPAQNILASAQIWIWMQQHLLTARNAT
ncbi:hypothetical protein [Vannielia sp.]|uniref:hypothetical protein n=1 Tax=Vannielia sp. TaxID=2813045 RepID=UPI00263024A6|nr:hypothetical protein [Vannielia sp.]MDF1871100.1 hypothetical protein [Vannielia sp.]